MRSGSLSARAACPPDQLTTKTKCVSERRATLEVSVAAWYDTATLLACQSERLNCALIKQLFESISFFYVKYKKNHRQDEDEVKCDADYKNQEWFNRLMAQDHYKADRISTRRTPTLRCMISKLYLSCNNLGNDYFIVIQLFRSII